ncbi:MAG: prepilin-type N-terminal cleavage/methylation domain-containing protein [Patescibacteria group bacterium]|jgi:Tfp pilus assembly protein PilV
MFKPTNNQRGVTLMELLIYLGISSVVVLTMMTLMANVSKQRLQRIQQNTAQQAARVAVDKMTYSIRNAYRVDISADGKTLDIYSTNFADLTKPIVTTYSELDNQLYTGQSLETPPQPENLQPATPPGVILEQLSFREISSAVQVSLRCRNGARNAEISSTISFRQL